jgi:hypothetical protein
MVKEQEYSLGVCKFKYLGVSALECVNLCVCVSVSVCTRVHVKEKENKI